MKYKVEFKPKALKDCKSKHISKDPLHGVTLETILKCLVESCGWEELGRGLRIKCFTNNPSIKSSLTFLRKTPWARKKIEDLYIYFEKNNSKEKWQA